MAQAQAGADIVAIDACTAVTAHNGYPPSQPEDLAETVNLVEGEEAIVESPRGLFDPFIVHYAETFIVPAALGDFSVRPHGPSEGRECATIKAYVRT